MVTFYCHDLHKKQNKQSYGTQIERELCFIYYSSFLAMKNNHHGILIKSIVTSVPIFVLNYPKYQFSNRQYTKGNFRSIHISFHTHCAQIQRVNQ